MFHEYYLGLSLSPSSAIHTKSIDLLFETMVSLGVKEIIFTGPFSISREVNIRIDVKMGKYDWKISFYNNTNSYISIPSYWSDTLHVTE